MQDNEEKLRQFVESAENNNTEAVNKVLGSDLSPSSGESLGRKFAGIHDVQNEIGWEKLKILDLPTQGFFYPEGTEIVIRSATAGEIRHWSTLNEEDLSLLDDMLNYVLERCCNVKFPDGKFSSWRDIKEVDRFYILLAIRERTFVKGENKLQVKISESNRIDVVKDMINYITFDERLMEYYSPEERCLVLRFKNGKIMKIYLPSTGVTNWLKHYITRKKQMQEAIDEDFLNFAPFVIGDWRGLNDASYQQIVMDSQGWSTGEISMITEIRRIFADTINPVIKYHDEQGGERVIPLNFQGGIKSLFLISNPFAELA
jgi:hypothetical protein